MDSWNGVASPCRPLGHNRADRVVDEQALEWIQCPVVPHLREIINVVMTIRPLTMACPSLTKSRGISWKSSSVQGILSSGQRRYWYPPPWLYLMPQATLGVDPTVQLATSSAKLGGNTLEPRSPISKVLPSRETVAKTESPPTGVCLYLPPACPHGSTTGAEPGALQGLSGE